MASLIELGKSTLTGRSKIGIKGYYKNQIKIIDLDLVDSWIGTHNATISKHPIEKEPTQDNHLNIVDHVNVESPTIRLNCILSYQVLEKITAKEKLQIILHWQSCGTILEILGYGTGKSGIIKKILTWLNSGVGALYNSNIDDPAYLGIDSDIIQNIVIGNITVTRKPDLGDDIELALDVQRINFAIAKTSKKIQANSKVANKKPAQETTSKPTENQKVSSQNKKLFGDKK